MRLHGGTFDAMPLSLITTHTVTALCALAGVPGDALRFRPNLLVEPLVDAPYAEDAWVGRTLAVGDVGVRVDRRDPRCVIVNVDPGTGRSNSDRLRVPPPSARHEQGDQSRSGRTPPRTSRTTGSGICSASHSVPDPAWPGGHRTGDAVGELTPA